MRVAIHADAAAHSVPGGIGVYVRRLVDELLDSDDGNTYKLIVSRAAEPPARWSTQELIRPPLPFGQLYAAWNFTGRPKMSDEVDVVHATGLAIPPLKGALVSTIHDLAVERMPEVVPALWRKVYLKGLKISLDRAKVLCAVSEATKKDLIEVHSIDPDRIVVTPEAANVTPESPSLDAIFDRLGIAPPYVLCVGTVEPRKNQRRLVQALAEAGDGLKGWSLVIAGVAGWGQEQVQSEIDALNIGHRVTFTGKVSTPELASLYSKAGVFAFPSLYEGFGLPLVEALGFGIPSMASTDAALAEVAGDAALLVDPADTAAMADTLSRLATDESLRASLAAKGRARAAEFTWQKTAAATRDAYEKAAGS